jgi:hypothetical protein
MPRPKPRATRAMRRQVRRADRRAGQGGVERAQLYQGLRAGADPEAEADDRIVAVTAAMPDGTGLNLFAERFPKRCFDVGIAEQHA